VFEGDNEVPIYDEDNWETDDQSKENVSSENVEQSNNKSNMHNAVAMKRIEK
jgi:hypothetical protein